MRKDSGYKVYQIFSAEFIERSQLLEGEMAHNFSGKKMLDRLANMNENNTYSFGEISGRVNSVKFVNEGHHDDFLEISPEHFLTLEKAYKFRRKIEDIQLETIATQLSSSEELEEALVS